MAWQFNNIGLGGELGEALRRADDYNNKRADRAEDVRMKKSSDRAALEAKALESMGGYRKPEFDNEGLFKSFGENPEAFSRNRPILESQLPQFFEKKTQDARAAQILPPDQPDPGTDDLTAKINVETRKRRAAGDMRPVTMADVQGAPEAPLAPPPPPQPEPLLKDPKHDIEREKLAVKANGEAMKARGAIADADSAVLGDKVDKAAGPNGEDIRYADKTNVSFNDGANIESKVQPAQEEIKQTFNPTPELMNDIQKRAMTAPQRNADTLVPNATIPPPIREILGLPETGQTPSSVLKALLDFKKPGANAVDKTLPPGTYDAVAEIESGVPLSVAARKLTAGQRAALSPAQAAELRSAESRRIAKEQKDLQLQGIQGERDQKLADKEAKKQSAKASSDRTATVVVQDSGRILELLDKNPGSFGPVVGTVSKEIPGTPAWNANQILDTIKANLGFGALSEMRASSPTGAALGPVSDTENKLLQAAAGKLDPSLPPQVFGDNLKRVINQYNDVIHGPGNGPKRFKLSFDSEGRPQRPGEEKKGNAPSDKDVQKFKEVSAFATKKIREIDGMAGLNASQKRMYKKQVADRFESITGIPWTKQDGSPAAGSE